MNKEKEIERLVKDINSQLYKLESSFWDAYVAPGYETSASEKDYVREGKKTWLFYGTRTLYFKICRFLELKDAPFCLQMFKDKFGPIIYNKSEVMKSRGPLYEDSDPSMIIHDDFREFLSAFAEFDYDFMDKAETNKLKLILENTNSILAKTNAEIKNETSIYKQVRWYLDIIYPDTRRANKAAFIGKFKTYEPDILVPEISSAIEYKFIRKSESPGNYIDQIKTDADRYKGDSNYKFFYAVVYFEDKSEINPGAFEKGIKEAEFPENWTVMVV